MSHIKTEYLNIDKGKCKACGECVDKCPNKVLKVVGLKFIIQHKHVKVVRPDNCSGCLSCEEACSEGAITGVIY
jgi:NAD-dependent dihydropyrimidine dehydrogenase PreA subunit